MESIRPLTTMDCCRFNNKHIRKTTTRLINRRKPHNFKSNSISMNVNEYLHILKDPSINDQNVNWVLQLRQKMEFNKSKSK